MFPFLGMAHSFLCVLWVVCIERGATNRTHTNSTTFSTSGFDLGAGATFFQARRESLFPFLLVPVGNI